MSENTNSKPDHLQLTGSPLTFSEAGQTIRINAHVVDREEVWLEGEISWSSSAPGLISVVSQNINGTEVVVTAIVPTESINVRILATYESADGDVKLVATRYATFVRLANKQPQTHTSTVTAGALVTEFDFVVNLNFNRDYNQISIRTI